MSLDAFNGADRDDAIAMLRPCLDIDRWCAEITDGRPYRSVDEVVVRAEAAAAPLPDGRSPMRGWCARAPSISTVVNGAAATMSRAEQAGVDPADAEVAAALAAGNLAYERRFGRVFLIRAAGRSAGEILAALTERLGHTPEEEEPVIADQLRQIAVLRLKGLLA